MEYASNTLRRISEVFESLNIKADYNPKDKAFMLKPLNILITENLPARDVAYELFLNKIPIIQIKADGSFSFLDEDMKGLPSAIIFCKKCNRFSFVIQKAKGETKCSYCDSISIKYLAKNSIPCWFGKTSNFLIDENEINLRRNILDEKDKEQFEKIVTQLQGTPQYIQVDDEKLEKIKELENVYPNMKEVIAYILQNCQAASLKINNELSFKPIVLVGGPGCGKSSFSSDLCKILMGKPPLKLDLGNSIANFSLSGLDPSYKNAKHGLIVESMFAGKSGHPLKNPLIQLDELDKIKKEDKYSTETVFYAILEKGNARRFFDNYLGLNVDASGINYIFTANSLDNIAEPILNRMKIFQIQDYTHEEYKNYVLGSYYNKWLENNQMKREFLPAVLSDEIKERILEYASYDTRSLEDAIIKVFNETLTRDSETNQEIALFSARELYAGWKKFRGYKKISSDHWRPPVSF